MLAETEAPARLMHMHMHMHIPMPGQAGERRALPAVACLPHLRSSTTLNSKRNCTATFSGSVTTTRVSCG